MTLHACWQIALQQGLGFRMLWLLATEQVQGFDRAGSHRCREFRIQGTKASYTDSALPTQSCRRGRLSSRQGGFLLPESPILKKQNNIPVFKPPGTKSNFLCTYYCGCRSASTKPILWLHQRGKYDGASVRSPHSPHTQHGPMYFWIA